MMATLAQMTTATRGHSMISKCGISATRSTTPMPAMMGTTVPPVTPVQAALVQPHRSIAMISTPVPTIGVIQRRDVKIPTTPIRAAMETRARSAMPAPEEAAPREPG